jgi:excisionase family DNA binding protein
MRVADKLRPLMEEQIEQLALPLFESEPVDREPTQSKPRPPVSSRGLSQPSHESIAQALLTTGETADLLRVHPRTVQRLVERGDLSAVYVGAAVRFDPVDVCDLTTRLKRREEAAQRSAETVRRGRPARRSFAGRLRSDQHEHRAAQA